MNTLSEETPRVKSSGSAGGKNRRISIGIKTSGKSSGEEVNSVPNYLRASTGSCHDISQRNSSDKVQTQALQDGEAESEVYIESIKFDFIYPSMELKDPPACNESEPFSCKDIGEGESLITYTVNERSELIPDEELPENSTIMPTVIESSHASSDKEVSEESENEKEVAAAQNDEMETTAGVQDNVLDIESENNDSKNGRKSIVLKHQGEQEKKDAHGLLNNIIEETTSKLAESRKSKVKALVGAFETVISLSKTANPLPRRIEFSINSQLLELTHFFGRNVLLRIENNLHPREWEYDIWLLQPCKGKKSNNRSKCREKLPDRGHSAYVTGGVIGEIARNSSGRKLISSFQTLTLSMKPRGKSLTYKSITAAYRRGTDI
ncbi:ribonuclease H-like domain-containing protein [Tanacetum coccineum]